MAARLGIRMERASLTWGGALVAALGAGIAVTVIGMVVTVADTGCAPDFSGAACGGLAASFGPWESTAQLLIGLLWIIPTGLGALLGVGITAGEIEHRTASLSWSLSQPRIRWLLLRAVPVGVVLVAVLLVATGFAELATRTRLVTDDPGFHDYQLRTLLVPARGLLAFGVGLAVGALIGRSLPALLVAIVFSAAVTVGLLLLMDTWHLAAATFVTHDDPVLDGGTYPLIAGTGAVISGPGGEGLLVLPATEFWAWTLLEGALYAAAIVTAWVLAASIVERRSP